MSSQRRPTKPDPDETTAELPTLEGAAHGSDSEPRSASDTWIAPSLAGARGSETPLSSAAPEIHPPPESTAQTLSARLRESQGLLSAKDDRLRQLEHARDEALEARAAAERRAGQLDRELAQLQAEHAFQLDEHARARGHFEEQLAQARALLSAASARADGLQRRLAELESAARLDEDHQLQHRRQLEQDRARAAGVMGDLRHERERRLALVESLQSAESRRAILEELVTDLQREGEERERELARVARALVGRDAHARELQSDAGQSAGRIARLEQQVGSLSAAVAERDAQLRRSHQETRALQEGATTPRARPGSAGEPEGAAQPPGAVQDASGAGREAALAQQERGTRAPSLSAAEARIKELEDRAAEQQEAMKLLQSESSASLARARELEADLHAAEEAVHRLESDARSRGARLEELERANVRRRTADEARHAAPEPAAGSAPEPAPAGRAPAPPEPERSRAARGTAAAAATEPAAEGAARLLVRSEEGREIEHVLSRRTSIGRTPDNDLQIEAQFISRHHAVIMVGPVHTIIEDLNSTNGVQVNGRRVTRHILKDGDVVHIARLQYRFVVRKSGGDKR